MPKPRFCLLMCALFLAALLPVEGCAKKSSPTPTAPKPAPASPGRGPASVPTSGPGDAAPPTSGRPPDSFPAKGNGVDPGREAKNQDANRRLVTIYYATDRVRSGSAHAAEFYGAEGAADRRVELGTCEVSIPRVHEMGELESPLWGLRVLENPDKHVVLLSVKPAANASAYFDAIRFRMNREEKQAFVFIHGFNVTFEDAARRTGQLAYDLGFRGAPILYSWPSKGSSSPIAYTTDENTAEWAEAQLLAFLRDLPERLGTDRIFLIAHSMGSRVLTGALKHLEIERAAAALPGTAPATPPFAHLVLAAPDLDARVYRDQVVPFITRVTGGRTLYASSNDLALKASKQVHGKFPRAGEGGANLVIAPGVLTIDASASTTDLGLNHSYYGQDKVIADLIGLFAGKLDPAGRGLVEQIRDGAGTYYVFGPR